MSDQQNPQPDADDTPAEITHPGHLPPKPVPEAEGYVDKDDIVPTGPVPDADQDSTESAAQEGTTNEE